MAVTQKRPNGLYWVLHHGIWDMAKYEYTDESTHDWLIFGWEYPVPETDFEMVDERQMFYDHKLEARFILTYTTEKKKVFTFH